MPVVLFKHVTKNEWRTTQVQDLKPVPDNVNMLEHHDGKQNGYVCHAHVLLTQPAVIADIYLSLLA